MLHTAASDPAEPSQGQLEGSFSDRSGWTHRQGPGLESWSLRVALGDELSGPLIWSFVVGKSAFPETEPRPEFREAQTHYHRSPYFRIALGPQPKQFKFDQDIYGPNDFILFDARRFYKDPFGADGGEMLLIFGDRRGWPVTNRKMAGLSSSEIIAQGAAEYGDFGPWMTQVNLADEDADVGVKATFGTPRAGRLKGSLEDQSAWAELSDGSRIAAAVLGSRPDAPLVLMSANAPGASEGPAGTAHSDLFRIVTHGTCKIGDREYGAGSFVAVEAGTVIEEVVHGPEGSRQILLAADRTKWRLVDPQGQLLRSSRQDEVAGVVAQLDAEAAPANAHAE